MSNITPVVKEVEGDASVVSVTYGPMANGDVGLPIGLNHVLYNVRSVQVTGTLGAAGAATIEGSNDPAGGAYATLNDDFNVALVITALSLRSIHENPYLTRPRITAGDGTTALTVTFLLKVGQRLRV